ncbi:MAG TPA: helix-turn-helix domain-containing protein [Terriglobia bacterium]|nr:helix-turn-helix domain-containing protein [Terriglobia bacterium]
MATTLSAPKVIRRVRQRLQLSQEALSRALNATKGAIQHWERGRNNPDLARLLALRQLCPTGPERKELDGLIKQTQTDVAPLPNDAGKGEQKATRYTHLYTDQGTIRLLRKENDRLHNQVTRLETALKKREEEAERLRVLESIVKGVLEGSKSDLRAKVGESGAASSDNA